MAPSHVPSSPCPCGAHTAALKHVRLTLPRQPRSGLPGTRVPVPTGRRCAGTWTCVFSSAMTWSWDVFWGSLGRSGCPAVGRRRLQGCWEGRCALWVSRCPIFSASSCRSAKPLRLSLPRRQFVTVPQRVAGFPEPWWGQPTAGGCPSSSCLGIWGCWWGQLSSAGQPGCAQGFRGGGCSLSLLCPTMGLEGCGGDTVVRGGHSSAVGTGTGVRGRTPRGVRSQP